MTQTCPTSKDLRNVVDGSLSDIDSQAMELHIERCEACQHAIQEFAADGTFWKSAAKNLSDVKIVGPGLDRVIETLQHQSREEAEEIGEAIELKLSFIEPPVEPGTIGRLRHYDILRVAGRGGMGIVLKAFDRSLRRIVAIKLLAPHLAGNGQARQRFVREGRAAAAITHEHVVTIHAVEESPPFLVMQYVHGETLEARIHRNGSMDVREAVRIALQIAQGLAAAHAQGVVHRDIKPANILLENGVARVRITDFGLARAIDDASLTQSGVVAGTPQYMAPEQANGDAIDERADLFSLGSVLYTMLAGHAPFRATTAMGVLKRLCDNAARPIREINPETPDWLVVVINRLHAKRPADRFHSATEVAALLERGLAAMQTGATPASGWASALRVDAIPENSPPIENTSTQDPTSGPSWTEQTEGSRRVSGSLPPTPATHQSHSSFIFTDLGAIAKRLLPPYLLWLLFAVIGLGVMPFVSSIEMLCGGIAIITLLGLRAIRSLQSKPMNDVAIAIADSGNSTADSVALAIQKSFASIGPTRLFAWLAVWILPAIVWTGVFFFFVSYELSSGMSRALHSVNEKIILALLAVFFVWLVIAYFWFRRKHLDHSPVFSMHVRRKGMLSVAGLAAIFCACAYAGWWNSVYSPRLQRMALQNPPYSIPGAVAQQHFRVWVEFEGAQDGIDVVIDNGSPPIAWAPNGNSRSSTIPGNPGTFSWHATLGQSTFASGEVTLEAGKTAVINVPKPKLIDLIAGRWEHEANSSSRRVMQLSVADLEIKNIEMELHQETVIFANRTPGSSSRTDMTIQIDESVTPALITMVESRTGVRTEGIIRFEPHIADPQLDLSGIGPMGSTMGMGGDGAQHHRESDKLLICIGASGSLRPWQFESDPKQDIVLYELIRSDDPESLSRSLLLEPLPNETKASVVKESVEAWSKHLNVPIERRNSIGLDLTLVPPTTVDLPQDKALQEESLLLPRGTKVVDENSPKPFPSPKSDPSIHSPSEPKPIVSYPFVISRDVIKMAQFQQFMNDTGYLTDAERGEPLTKEESPTKTPLPAKFPPAPDSEVPVDDTVATPSPNAGTIGGWLREDGKFIWHDGLSWKKPTPAADGATFPAPTDSPLPVVMLSHNDAIAFCQWLSTKEKRQYRLPTSLEWTAANQLGAVKLPFDTEHVDANEHRTWFDVTQPNALGIRIATEIGGEWTSSALWEESREVIVVVKKDLSPEGLRFDLCNQSTFPPAFRSSEISFRVVAELQTLTTPDEEFPNLP